MKQAVIDIGSNSMRLSVYETTETGAFTILFKDKIMAGLAGYVEEGALSPEGITGPSWVCGPSGAPCVP